MISRHGNSLPVTSKKTFVCLFYFILFFLCIFFIFFYHFLKSLHSQSLQKVHVWGREVMWLDFPLSALERLTPFFLFLTKTLTFLSAWFHFFFLTPVPFLSSKGGSIYTCMCEWGNAMSNKCVCVCSPRCSTCEFISKKDRREKRTRRDLFWKLKKKKVLRCVSRSRPDQLGADRPRQQRWQ